MKIQVFVNGVYEYTTTKYRTCKDAIKDAHATKHIFIAGIPNRYLTIYDYDKVTAKRA